MRACTHKNIAKVLTICQLPPDFPGLCPDSDYNTPTWGLVMEYVGVSVIAATACVHAKLCLHRIAVCEYMSRQGRMKRPALLAACEYCCT